MRRCLFSTMVTFLLLAFSVCRKPEAPRGSAMTGFIDDYFNAYFDWNPSSATAVGFHQYDNNLEDYSAAAFEKRIEKLEQLQGRLASLPAERTPDDAIDIEILDGQIKAELLDLETLQTWRKNPMNYAGLPGSAIDGLIKRDFAPASQRVRSVTARLKGVPAILEAMRQNVRNPPREFADLAFRIAHGSIDFFRREIAGWAKGASVDSALLRSFEDANDAAALAMEQAARWL